MAKKRSEERRMQDMVELGQENAQLWPKVQNWCKHLQIKMVSAGLLARAYNLPIGFVEITCEHASAGGIQAMQLREVATYFVLNNCRGCPFHEALDIDNIGQTILKASEEIQTQRRLAADSREDLKARLSGLVSGDLVAALNQQDITEQSISQLALLLDDEKYHIEAARALVHAAEIAPELFTDPAVQFICRHFDNQEHGTDCITSIRTLGKQRGQLPATALDEAKRCLLNQQNADEACGLIGDWIVESNAVLEPELIDAILDVQQHGHIVGSSLPSHREYPGSEYTLVEIGKRNHPLLIDALKSRLERNDKQSRINAAHIVQSLVDSLPDLAIQVIDPLIAALELDDDMDMESSDATTCQTLAMIYVRHPVETQEKIEAGYKRASTEAKGLIYDVYRRIALPPNSWFTAEGEQANSLYLAAIPQTIPFVLQAISAFGTAIEVKDAAAEALASISSHYPDALVVHLDLLLGILLNLGKERDLLAAKKTEGALANLEKQSQEAQYAAVVNRVIGALKAVCTVAPTNVLERLAEIMPNLDSNQQETARYKGELTSLYGKLAYSYDTIPVIIPELYKPFMDFKSANVRRAAVGALGEILQRGPDAVPRNMLDVLVLYLSDPEVCMPAVRAIRYADIDDVEMRRQIAARLLVLDKAFLENPHFRLEILDALIDITREDSELLSGVTTRLIIKLARVQDEHIAFESLEKFERLLPGLPQQYKVLFAREVLGYLKWSQRDRYNYEPYSSRFQLMLELFALPKESVINNLSLLQETARAKATDDPLDAFYLIQLLLHFEMYAEAAQLASEISAVQPTTKRFEPIIRDATLLNELAQVESLVSQGAIEVALGKMDELSKMEGQSDDKKRSARDVVDAFEVAQRISKRMP